jgi:hypothetical protein
MATSREITNNAVGFEHLGPGAMTGVFNQQPARVTVSKKYDIGKCGAGVALEAHTTADAVVMSVGECGLSGVICQTCLQEIDAIINRSEAELLAEAAEEPGLHGQG